MLPWLIVGIALAGLVVFRVLYDAIKDDKKRKKGDKRRAAAQRLSRDS